MPGREEGTMSFWYFILFSYVLLSLYVGTRILWVQTSSYWTRPKLEERIVKNKIVLLATIALWIICVLLWPYLLKIGWGKESW